MLYVSFVEIFYKGVDALAGACGDYWGYWINVASLFGGMFLIGIIDNLIPSAENPHETHAGEATKWAFSQNGRPYSIWRLERIWNMACKNAKIKITLYNGLKYCFGCQRIEQGFTKVDLKEVFGHRDMRSVDRYAKYQIGRVGEIMRGRFCANLVQAKMEVSNYAK
jgi:hypothetical protein